VAAGAGHAPVDRDEGPLRADAAAGQQLGGAAAAVNHQLHRTGGAQRHVVEAEARGAAVAGRAHLNGQGREGRRAGAAAVGQGDRGALGRGRQGEQLGREAPLPVRLQGLGHGAPPVHGGEQQLVEELHLVVIDPERRGARRADRLAAGATPAVQERIDQPVRGGLGGAHSCRGRAGHQQHEEDEQNVGSGGAHHLRL
jgi:hypothetical protein